ncbi:MAG: hypothetical protein ACI4Q4_03815, partial [Oscillospiraceae bacterium]
MAQFFNFEGDYLGLSEEEAARSVELYGLNTYTKGDSGEKRFSPVSAVLNPTVIMLFLAGVFSFFSAGVGTGIAVLLLDAAYAAVEIIIGMKTDAQLADLRESTAMKYRVIRGGKLVLVHREEILTDDLLVVQAGERVPVDAFIRESRDLVVDEFALSDSHKSVVKNSGAAKRSALNDSFVYSGSTVLGGIAICEVTAIGVDTKYYQKHGAQPERHPYRTRLESDAATFSLLCTAVACLAMLVTMISSLAGKMAFSPAIVRGLIFGLCFFPTGLCTVIRLYYSRCAAALLRNNAVVKSLDDIEKLNSMSVLCVEKSGVISRETMEVRGVYTDSEELLYNIAVLTCAQNSSDPAERALTLKATFFDEHIFDVCE